MVFFRKYGRFKFGIWAYHLNVVIEHLTALTWVSLIQCYDFLKAYKETFQMMCLNPKFRRGPNLSFFGLGPWYRQIYLNFEDTI